jgi:hypothetical protein
MDMKRKFFLGWLALVLSLIFLVNPAYSKNFTMPPAEEGTWRKLDWNELRFYRRVVGKINRVGWYAVDSKTTYWVPNQLDDFRDWSPLPKFWPEYSQYPKMILASVGEYFFGRLEYGHLIDWSNMLAGPAARPGSYRVLQKKKDKYSSYRDSSGNPIPMPNALRLYGAVWAHGGDAYGPHHVGKGCLNTPNDYADPVFEWAEIGTPVVILR